MGIQMSAVKHLLSQQSASEWCLPVAPYSAFTKEQWPAGQDGLVTDFQVLPEKLHRVTDDGSWFWWCDAEFAPFNDTFLYASASAFNPRPGQRWVQVPSMPNGRVLLYKLTAPDHMQCNIFSRTSCSVFPKLDPHPLGELVAYCGTGEVAVMATNGDPVYSRSRDLTNAVHVYCAVGNNGISFACLKRGMGVFFLEYFTLDSNMVGSNSLRCHSVCPNFFPSKTGCDNVACKFSPDCNFLAVSSALGFLFVVKRKTLVKHCIICPTMAEAYLSTAESFDFHPRFPYEVLTFATTDNNLETINSETGDVLMSVETDDRVDCLTYSRDGLFIAVGFHNFDISILSGDDLGQTHSISMSALCSDHTQRVQLNFPAILHVSFTQNGEHLASTSCDGHLRIWRIPRLFSLQEICRDTILKCLTIKDVKKLKDIPEKMRNFLIYKYF